MVEKINIVVGFDQREAVAYHVFTQSIIEKASLPVVFIPLAVNTLCSYSETHADRSNDFIYSRFLTPYLNQFQGWAVFADGDMVCQADIAELWRLRDESKAILVVKHEYQTKAHIKYLGNINENYPRKNWSSLILWNCKHPKHKILTPEFIESRSGKFLHRFAWLDDSDIGELPREWNWLVTEYPNNPSAKILHYTLGTPCFNDYKDSDMAEYWHAAIKKSLQGLE
jgi:lipopolysaccharide biosynthesis glycosyltransferase